MKLTEAENAALREALEWAIAEIEGRTRYDGAEQFDNALATAKRNLSTDGMYREPRAALRMIREAVEELFGPIASLESEEATLLRGPELIHEAEAIVEALRRVADEHCNVIHDLDRYIDLCSSLAEGNSIYWYPEWQPIDTAPRDGTVVLIYAPPHAGLGDIICKASWHEDAGWCVDELRDVTHWMPMPSPPAMKEGR